MHCAIEKGFKQEPPGKEKYSSSPCAGGNFKLSSFESLPISVFYLITDLTESELGNFVTTHVLILHLRCINLISYIDEKCKGDNNDANDMYFLA